MSSAKDNSRHILIVVAKLNHVASVGAACKNDCLASFDTVRYEAFSNLEERVHILFLSDEASGTSARMNLLEARKVAKVVLVKA